MTDWNLWGHSNSLGTINAILFLTNLTELLKIFCRVKAAERAADVTQLHRMRTDFVRGILELDMLSFLF